GLPPGPGGPHRRGMGAVGLRRRTRGAGQRTAEAQQPAAGRRRHAAVLRLRGPVPARRPHRQPRPGHRGTGVGAAQPGSVLRGIHPRRRDRSGPAPGGAARVRIRQGGLRSPVRGPPPAALDQYSAGLDHGADRVTARPAVRQPAGLPCPQPCNRYGYPMTNALLAEIDALVAGTHHNPHALLGAHPGPEGVWVRALRPLARPVHVLLANGSRVELPHLHHGLFAGVGPRAEVPDYRLVVRYDDGTELTVDDPYRHLPTLGELDIHLIQEGRHEELWRVLGAHTKRFPSVLGDTEGTAFTVWAPNARGVRVIGDFNHWDGTGHPMRSLGSCGVWELCIPGVGDGTRYKYQVLGADGVWREKADPVAFATQAPPETASVVFTSRYTWQDDEWLTQRAAADLHRKPMSIYEVHLGSWRPGLSYRELADQLVDYVRELGFTHVEFLPVAEHPFGGSWGYQV